MEIIGFERLDKILIVEVFSFVPVKDYKNLETVSRLFRECCRSDYLWKNACVLLFPNATQGFYNHFMSNIHRFKRISDSFYKIIKKLEESEAFELVSKLKSTSNPKLSNILNHYITESNISKLDKKSSFLEVLPTANSEELAWSHLLYNGQNILDPGLFGCYEFYDVYVSLAYMRLDQTQSANIIACSENNGERLLIFQDSENTIKKGKGAVYCTTGFQKFLYLAESFSEYLESYANKLWKGVLRVDQGKILLHEYNEYSSCNSEFGIKITASALFVPHVSRPGRFTWTYLITIEDDNVERTYKLTTRTWVIEDSNGEVTRVDRQPGVIGMYPKVMRGSAPFSYSSCCYLKTLSGTMSGFFTFIDGFTGTSIDVNIKPFRLEIPLGSRIVGLIVKTVTWSRDSHGLYDYESRNVYKKSIQLTSSSLLQREGYEVKTVQMLPSSSPAEGILCKISQEGQDYFVSCEGETIWKVARTMHTKHGPGFILKEGDVIKLGRICFKVTILKTSPDLEESDKTQDSEDLDLGIPNERDNGTCKICLMNDSDSTNPLISPCKCSGSMKFIHLECLRHWIKSRMISRNTENCITYSWKSLDCEICKSNIPFSFDGSGNQHEFLKIQKPNSPFIVLEGVGNDKNSNKGVHVVALTGASGVILGRGHEADVRISDISVSRTHAAIKFIEGCFVVEDKNSKFGTLLNCEDRLKIGNSGYQVVQIGRTIVSFSTKNHQHGIEHLDSAN